MIMSDISSKHASENSDTLTQPSFKVPAQACDTHLHIFGPAEKFPYASELRYVPPLAPLDEYLALADQLNIERMVFVQPSAYGKDNSCMLEAMAAMGNRCRGVIGIDEKVTDKELEQLREEGVCGIRINVSPYKTYEAGFAEQLIGPVNHLAKRARRLGLHLQFLSPGWLVQELILTLRKLPVPFVIDHMGLFPAREGIEQHGFQGLLRLVGEGQCWVKLSAPYRFSSMPGFKDLTPFAKALIEASPDRILWGSDFPHLSFRDRVDTLNLFNLLGEWAPDEAQRQKILVDNPQNLFVFS